MVFPTARPILRRVDDSETLRPLHPFNLAVIYPLHPYAYLRQLRMNYKIKACPGLP